MKTLLMAMSLIVSSTLAQASDSSSPVSAGNDPFCVGCASGEIKPLNEQEQKAFIKSVIDSSKASSRVGSQKVIEDMAREENLNHGKGEKLTNEQPARPRFVVNIDSLDSFDTMTARQLAEDLQYAGYRDMDFVDVRISRKLDELDQNRAKSRLKDALRTVLLGRSVRAEDEPHDSHSIGIKNILKSDRHLEARIDRVLPSQIHYSTGVSFGKNQSGQREPVLTFYIGGKFDGNFHFRK